jgi:hypothetical protein
MNNNANLEMLFKLIIPAIFVVLWTLNSLFNKELQNQQRNPRATSPLGPRPGLAPLNRPGAPVARTERDFGGATPGFARERSRSNEGVVFLPEGDGPGWTVRQQPAKGPQYPPRKPGRGRGKVRQAQQGPPRETAAQPAVKSPISQHSAQDAAALDVFDSPQAASVSAPTAEEMRGMLRDPSNIRQVFVLHEILSPPRSVMNRRRFTR